MLADAQCPRHQIPDIRSARLPHGSTTSLQRRRRRRTAAMLPVRADSGVVDWVEAQNAGAVKTAKFLGGSSWSSAYLYETTGGSRFFVKTSPQQGAEAMFAGEALGLQAMHATQTLRVPAALHHGPLPGGATGGFIAMEHLQLGGRVDQAELGRRLARMHLAEPSDPRARAGEFGFAVDNTIGGTPQPNGWAISWVEFFRERRLRHQLRLANDARLSRLGDALCDNLGAFFEGVEVQPATLHGDLWSGNIAMAGGEPCVFDPATYYGHSEAEFGMSWCASFSGEFWEAYHELLPRAPGWEDRRVLYVLYHHLNHLNLFGAGYYGECERALSRLVRKL